MNFKFLTGDVNWQTYGGKFVSKKLNNGLFDYWLVLDVFNWEEMTGDAEQGTYCVTVYQVAPSQASEDTIQSALDSWGYTREQLDDWDDPDLALVELLADYGNGVPHWQESGNNLGRLLKEARARAAHIAQFNPNYLERRVNALGTNGWNWLKGDITAGLRDNEPEDVDEE